MAKHKHKKDEEEIDVEERPIDFNDIWMRDFQVRDTQVLVSERIEYLMEAFDELNYYYTQYHFHKKSAIKLMQNILRSCESCHDELARGYDQMVRDKRGIEI
jgi:RNase P subunit RPR2